MSIKDRLTWRMFLIKWAVVDAYSRIVYKLAKKVIDLGKKFPVLDKVAYVMTNHYADIVSCKVDMANWSTMFVEGLK